MAVDPEAVRLSVERLMAGLTPARSLGAQAPPDGLAKLAREAEQVLAVRCVGVLLLDDFGHLRAAAASGPLATALELAQIDTGVGPGIDTMNDRGAVTCNDLAEVERYRPLADQVAHSGVRAVLSAPIWIDGQLAGNLNALLDRAHPWTAAEASAAQAFADVVGALLTTNS